MQPAQRQRCADQAKGSGSSGRRPTDCRSVCGRCFGTRPLAGSRCRARAARAAATKRLDDRWSVLVRPRPPCVRATRWKADGAPGSVAEQRMLSFDGHVRPVAGRADACPASREWMARFGKAPRSGRPPPHRILVRGAGGIVPVEDCDTARCQREIAAAEASRVNHSAVQANEAVQRRQQLDDRYPRSGPECPRRQLPSATAERRRARIALRVENSEPIVGPAPGDTAASEYA